MYRNITSHILNLKSFFFVFNLICMLFFLICQSGIMAQAPIDDIIAPVGQVEPEALRERHFMENYRLSTAVTSSAVFGSLQSVLPYSLGADLALDLTSYLGKRLDVRLNYAFSNYTKNKSVLNTHDLLIGPAWNINLGKDGKAGAFVLSLLLGASIFNYNYFSQKGISATFASKFSFIYEFSLKHLTNITGRAFFSFYWCLFFLFI